MKVRWRAIFLFYRTFAAFSLAVSALAWGVSEAPLGLALLRFLPLFFFFKCISNALIWYYIITFEGHRLHFYYNLCISKMQLFMCAFALDFMLFLMFLLAVNLIF